MLVLEFAYDGAIKKRFESRFVRDSKTGCWLWQSGLHTNGYGQFSIGPQGKAKNYLAHRVAYELFRGAIPKGLTIDHLCRVRHCVNPDHLEAVPHKINNARGIGVSAINARKKHCKKGHPFDLFNTQFFVSRGIIHRHCRECKRLEFRNRYRRQHGISI